MIPANSKKAQGLLKLGTVRGMQRWERQATIADRVYDILMLITAGTFDPNDDSDLAETPERVARAFIQEWFSGYDQDLDEIVRVFPNESGERDLVMVKDIPFYSTCAHHMAPFFGRAAIGYVPDKQVIGLSKLSRILTAYSRRLQLQERITQEVIGWLDHNLKPQGAMVVLYDCEHTCMTSRGVQAHGSKTTTSAVRGLFETDSALRAEFLSLIKS